MTYRRLPERRSAQQIAELAQDIVGGRVITTDYFAERGDHQTARMVFMAIPLGALAGYRQAQLRRLIVLAVDGVDTTAGGMGVNGFHMYVSCQIWRRTDYAQAVELARRAHAVLYPETVTPPG